jgi:hypothetical protein
MYGLVTVIQLTTNRTSVINSGYCWVSLRQPNLITAMITVMMICKVL